MRAFICSLALISLSATAATPVHVSPLGAYQKRLYDSIGLRWYLKVQAHKRRLTPGTVRIQFAIRGDGTIENLSLVSNTSDKLHARIVLDAVRHAAIPRPPRESLKDDRLEQDITFTLYPKKT